VPRVDHQDDKLTLVDRVEQPVIADPDPQNPVRACNHLGAIWPRIRGQSING
jgi:hypothetical protein